MAVITFATRSTSVDVHDTERSRFRIMLSDLAWRAVERDCDPHEYQGRSILRDALNLPGWVADSQGRDFAANISMSLGALAPTPVLLPGDGGPGPTPAVSALDVAVNTVLAGYNDEVALAVRIAVQEPEVLWIDPTDRDWAAALIESCRRTPWPAEIAQPPAGRLPIFHDPGWTAVVDLLRADTTDTVVMSYSVGDPFPWQYWAGEGEHRDRFREWWRTATAEQKWKKCETGLREQTERYGLRLRLSPDTLHQAYTADQSLTWSTVAAAWRTANTTHVEGTRPS